MNQEAMRKQMEDVRDELNRLDEQKVALETILKGYEAWFRANPESGMRSHRQMEMAVPGRGGAPKGTVSFRQALKEVLQQARGEPLHEDEIWRRMQEKGAKSEAKHPIGFVSLTARQFDEAEKVAVRTWRWKASSTTTNQQNGESH